METLTPVKSKPLNGLTHNLSGLITSTRGVFVPNLVKIRSRGLLGKGVKYNFLCDFFIYFFFSDQRRGDPWTDFDAQWLKRREIAQGCPFGVIK